MSSKTGWGINILYLLTGPIGADVSGIPPYEGGTSLTEDC